MGCGKSVVGVLVAQRAGAPFHDLDFVIENEAGMSISDFATKGEAAFRAMEGDRSTDEVADEVLKLWSD
jgi:shikimate kinase